MTERKIDLIFEGVVHSKKNSKQIIRGRDGAPRIISNALSRQGEEEMRRQFAEQLLATGDAFLKKRIYQNRAIALSDAKDAHETYSIDFIIYAPNNIRRDLDNQVTSILDALVKAGAIVDDSFHFLKAFTVRFGGIDKIRPRAEIALKIHREE